MTTTRHSPPALRRLRSEAGLVFAIVTLVAFIPATIFGHQQILPAAEIGEVIAPVDPLREEKKDPATTEEVTDGTLPTYEEETTY